MATLSAKSPVTRETSAYTRDRGMRPIIATLSGGVLTLRAKGLRSREMLDLAWCYSTAVKQRVAQERAEKQAERRAAKAGQSKPRRAVLRLARRAA
jgi:hypothetical protein